MIILLCKSCYYDSEEYLFPTANTNCDTTQVTFSASVQPILQNSCLSCHSNNVSASLGGNIKLQDYSDVKIQADNGRLFGAIAHLNGVSPMPKGGQKLDDCKINVIKKWIDLGAPDN